MVLVHWIYTKQEWNSFLRKKLLSGEWRMVIRVFFSFRKRKLPEVRITPERVFIGDHPTVVSSGKHRIRRISIRESGRINIMQIMYEKAGKTGLCQVEVPVPKGRLIEAFEVEERLLWPLVSNSRV